MKKIYTHTRLLLTVLIAIMYATTVSAQPPGWSYSKAYHVTENAGLSLQDYQVSLTINTQALIAAGQMNADGSDLRFSADCGAGATFLEYYIVSGLNTTTTTIWIKIPVILANSTVPLYMFYGNPLATPMSNISNVFIGPMSSTDSVANGGPGGVTNSQRGFRFGVSEEILVTHFGKNEPNGTQRYVTLFDFNTQGILSQTQVSGPAAQYSYGQLTQPIWLTPGNQYVLELYQGNSDGYYYGNSSQAGQEIIYYDMRYCNSCDQNTFPTNTLSNYHYGYPDLWYYKRQHATVEPTVTEATPFAADAGTDQTVCSGTAATLTATGGSSYAWSTTETTDVINVSPANTTTYIVTVTNIAGCTDTASVTVNVNQLPNASAGTDQTICNGQTVALTATGGNSYAWSTTDNTAAISVSPSITTTYTVTATDNNGCSNTASATINVNQLPNASAGSDQTICNGETATLTATGGSSYVWNTTETTDAVSVTPLNTTTYQVTVTDNNNCSNTAAATVNVNQLPNASAGTDETICNGETATLTATGGNSYVWNTTETTDAINASPNTTTTYSVTVTDNNNCSNTASVTVNVNQLPNAGAGNDQTICNGQTATLTATGGDSYAWNTTETTASVTVSPVSTTTYSVTVTDVNSCSNTATATVTVNDLPNASAGNDQTICNGQSATLDATGGDSYAWTTTETTASVTVSPVSTTTYTVTVTDVNSCSNTATATVTVNDLPAAAVTGTSTICAGDTVTLTATGGTTFSWSTTETTDVIEVTPQSNDTYTVTVTDGNNCSATASASVTVNALPAAPVISASGSTLTATQASAYQWYLNNGAISGATAQSVTASSGGVYSVVITDANGCSNTSADFVYTGIAPIYSSGGFDIYPNPSNGLVNIRQLNSADNVNLKVTNVAGQEVHKSQFSKTTLIDLTQQPAGTYVIYLSGKWGTTTYKINLTR